MNKLVMAILSSFAIGCGSATGGPDASGADSGLAAEPDAARLNDAGSSTEAGSSADLGSLADGGTPDAGAQDASTGIDPLRCVGTYGSGPSITFRADGTVTLVTEGTYEYLDANTVRLTSPSWDPSTLEGSFAADCSTFGSPTLGTLPRVMGGRCGDGTVDSAFAEVCDDGNSSRCTGPCSNDCLVRITGCGDGIVCAAEQCDDRGASATCRVDCTIDPCGNGTVDSGEVCDDGNRTSGDGCRSDCRGRETCGDGLLDGNEVCDDRNVTVGDGCNAMCAAEPGCRCAVAGQACTTAFENPRGATVEIIQSIDRVATGVTIGGVPQYRDVTWALGVRNGLRVYSSEGYPIAPWELRPVPAQRGSFVLISGTKLVGISSGLGGSVLVGDVTVSPSQLTDPNNQWRLVYASSDARGDRFSLFNVARGRFLCPGRASSGSLERPAEAAMPSCSWLIRGTAPSAACTWSQRCGDGFLAVGEACDDGNSMGGDGCSATCVAE